jgi:hypothetical protein
MASDVVLRALGQAWKCLDAFPGRKAVFGGLALSAWNHSRSTKDVDIIFDPAGTPLHAILAKLGSADFRAKGSSAIIRLEDAEMPIQVDLLIATSEFDAQALSRRETFPVPELGHDMSVIRCEDLIVMKLRAGRLIDRADVVALLSANGDSIDLGHLATWVGKFGLQHKFRESWTEAFPEKLSPI